MVDGSAGATSLITSLEEGNFHLKVWFPEEGETSLCSAENLGSVPDGGNIYIGNLQTFVVQHLLQISPATGLFTFDKAVVYQFTTPPATAYTDASVKIEAFSNPYYIGATHDVLGTAGGNMGLLAGDEINLQLALYSPGACGSSH